MASKTDGPHLFKIIAVIIVVAVVALGVLRVSQMFQGYLNKGVEAAALENLDKAQQLLADGNMEEAGKLLQPILARVDNPTISPKALMLQATLDQQSGNTEAALEHLRAASQDFDDNPDQPVAALTYARLLEEADREEEALAIYAEIRDSAPPTLRAPALVRLARHEEQTNPDEAQATYRRAMDDAEAGSDDWMDAAEGHGNINVAKIFASDPTTDSKVYRVQRGDTLTSIGIKLNTTQGLLMRANNMSDPNRLRPNQNLKYTPKDFEIVIERSTLRLYLLDNHGLFKVYRVGLGKPGNVTTLGRYKVGNKEKDPTWHKPGFGPIPAGDPKNELGTRWMPMVPEEESLPRDLGIHGTIAPDTVGLYSSMGCPRLTNELVEELYDLVVRSTPVRVVEVFDPGQFE